MKWNIKTRLFAGCGVLVATLAIACILGWRQAASSENHITGIIHQNQSDFARFETMQASANAVRDTRRAEKEFLLRKDPVFVQTVMTKMAKIKSRLNSLVGTKGGTNAQIVTNALILANRYEAAFSKMADLLVKRGLTQDDGLEGQLRKAVHSVEGVVTNQGIAELDVLLLKCRRHEKDYLLRGNTNYLADIALRIGEFKQQMVMFSLPGVAQTNATMALEVYFRSMQGIVDIDTTIKAAGTECQDISEKFNQQMNELSQATADGIEADQKNALTLMASGKHFMLLLLGAGVILGGLVASVLTRSITRPIQAALRTLATTSDQATAASAQIAASSQSLAEGASEQAASLEETGASLEEITSMVKRNAEAATKAKDLAGQTRTAADTGTRDMVEMEAAMNDIRASSAEVSKIMKDIDEIAFQTNILALNAAVEAARAGAAGLGFAVVADEVRNLAQRSAKSAKETAAKIEAAMDKSERGVQISSRVAANFTQIASKTREVDQFVAEIALASTEQAQGVQQVALAVSHMDKVTQSNAANAEETASASEELKSQAAAVCQTVAELQQLVGVSQGHNNPAETTKLESHQSKNLPATKLRPSAKLESAKSLASAPATSSRSGSSKSQANNHHARAMAIPLPEEGSFKDF